MTGWRLFLTVAVLGFAIGAGLAWLTNRDLDLPDPGQAGASVGEAQPGFSHRNLAGETVTDAAFADRALLVNFWATWCTPCRREMPVLQDASERHADKLRVVGIALDDPEPVARFVEEIGVDYPILVGQNDVMDTQRAWGNDAGALPYTVLVDADGTVRWQHYGEVTAEELDKALAGVM